MRAHTEALGTQQNIFVYLSYIYDSNKRRNYIYVLR
jgi:hypothetical protein